MKIEDLLGIALGCMGLSLADFCILTPEEWDAVYRSWTERERHLQQAEWERMRMLATITIQPHCRKKLTPGQLLKFPWEKRKESDNVVSRDIGKARFDRLMEKLKNGTDNDRHETGQ